jgi:hypothetical protein
VQLCEHFGYPDNHHDNSVFFPAWIKLVIRSTRFTDPTQFSNYSGSKFFLDETHPEDNSFKTIETQVTGAPMKAYVLKKTGAPRILKMEEVDTPLMVSSEVRVKIQSIGLNYAEIQSRKGLYGWAPKRPYIPGMEAFGIIEEVGADVATLKTGMPVIVVGQFGCYAEEVVVPETQMLPLPFSS